MSTNIQHSFTLLQRTKNVIQHTFVLQNSTRKCQIQHLLTQISLQINLNLVLNELYFRLKRDKIPFQTNYKSHI